VGGDYDICCDTFDFGLAIRQFQLGRMIDVNSPYKDLMARWSCVAGWVMRHRLAAACLIVVLSWLPFLSSLHAGKQGDVAVYESDAYDLMEGRMPYRDVLLEHPPYAILIFLLPPAFGSHNYLNGFKILAVACDMLIMAGLFCAGIWHTRSLRSLLPLICYCAAVPFLKHIFLQRFDLWLALAGVVALLLFCADEPGGAGLTIAIGIGMKSYPAVFVPPFFVLARIQTLHRAHLLPQAEPSGHGPNGDQPGVDGMICVGDKFQL
jgi:hypothetical protein